MALTDAQLQQRRELIDDLKYAIKEDNYLLGELLDDLISRLSDKEVGEYEVLVGSIFGD